MVRVLPWVAITPQVVLGVNRYVVMVSVVVMVMDEDSKYARPVAHLYKGQTFGVSSSIYFTAELMTRDA